MKKNEYRKQIQEAFLQTLKEMEQNDTNFWTCPWFVGTSPQNGKTKREYNGHNKAYLRYRQSELHSNDPRWYTFNQIKDVKNEIHKDQKWTLKKGSKGTPVEYWYPYDTVRRCRIDWDDFEGTDDNIVLLAYYQTVFNGSQIEGIEPYKEEIRGTTERSEVIEKISKGMNVPIYEDEDNRAYYIPSKDEIHLPRSGLFKSSSSFNATALHELSHATGNEKRLNRNIKNYFGGKDYAFEELIAEISSCYCLELLGEKIEKDEINNSKSYIKSWIQGIEEKPEALFKAFKEAEKAYDFIANTLKDPQ